MHVMRQVPIQCINSKIQSIIHWNNWAFV